MAYKAFKFFNYNPQGRDFVVGDIHGYFSAFEKLLWQINFDPKKDRVFSVGDMIDRGPESERAIEFLNYDWFHAIRGNHEQMLLDSAASTQISRNWTTFNGGDWWKNIPPHLHHRIRNVIGKLPLAFEVSTTKGRVGVVHADIPTGMSWQNFVSQLDDDQDVIDQALWSRTRFKQLQMMGRTQPVSGIDMIVFGHTPVHKPVCESNIIYIDTGAAYPKDRRLGQLTMLEIQPQMTLHQIKTDPKTGRMVKRQKRKRVAEETVPA
ncbi:MAG: phosphoprotein phosphatase [Thiotrichales bacterium]|nr:MAG: phosphoprotein phosphatase [Thiotrichales bacterium]